MSVTTACARCSATIDPAAVEAHHEQCFVVGDWVRWEVGDRWHEGRITSVCVDSGYGSTATIHCTRGSRCSGYPFEISFMQKNLRHIQGAHYGHEIADQSVSYANHSVPHRVIR